MNATAAPQKNQHLPLASAYLTDFLATLTPCLVNCCLVSPWFDGSVDQALQALRAGDPKRAAAMLALATEQAAQPVPADEADNLEAQEERQRIALAVRVALGLMGQPLPTTPPTRG